MAERWTARDYYERAEECGRRGQACANAPTVEQQLRELIIQARLFRDLEQQKEQIQRRLAREELHISECREARELYEAARQRLDTAQGQLEEWWQRVAAAACARLRQQAQTVPPEKGIFDHIEPWICIMLLTGLPDEVTRAQLARLSYVVDDLERKVETETRDFEATAHPEYQTLDKQAILKRQIDFCTDLQKGLREPQLAVQICSPYIGNEAIPLSQRLHHVAQELDSWIERLKHFERDLGTVQALANFGLISGDFQPTDNAIALASGGLVSPTPGVPQPGLGFQGFTLHPTFVWLKEFVARQKQRRESQREHKQYIEWGLALEHVTDVEELAKIERQEKDRLQQAPSLAEKYSQFIREMQQALAVGRYPIELVFERLEKMHHDEPQDVCQLQAQLTYRDPETLKSYEGFTTIHPILEAKVRQIRNLREWLDQFKPIGLQITVRRVCPGVVDWATEKPLIEKQRDRCELRHALKHCQSVRWGEEGTEPLFNGLWPLERAKQALTVLPEGLTPPKSQAARLLNTQRLKQIEELETQIAECQKIAQDIEWRITEQPRRKAQVYEQLYFLREARDSLWNKLPWGRNNVENARKALEEECRRYAEICPCDPEFLKVLDEEGLSIPLPRCDSLEEG